LTSELIEPPPPGQEREKTPAIKYVIKNFHQRIKKVGKDRTAARPYIYTAVES
jgi:hypothetical protein